MTKPLHDVGNAVIMRCVRVNELAPVGPTLMGLPSLVTIDVAPVKSSSWAFSLLAEPTIMNSLVPAVSNVVLDGASPELILV